MVSAALLDESHEAPEEVKELLGGWVEGGAVNVGSADDHVAEPVKSLEDLVLTAIAVEKA